MQDLDTVGDEDKVAEDDDVDEEESYRGPPPPVHHTLTGLPPLPFIAPSGAVRRESTLPMVDEATAPRNGRTRSSIFVYRHAENKKKRKNKKNKDSYREVDDTRPGFIDESLLTQKENKL